MNNNDGLMWKLLRKHVSASQLVGFSIANLIGLAIVLVAVQFYCDVKPVLNDEDSFFKRDYLIMTRRVAGLGALVSEEANSFSKSDIADLEKQSWVRKVGQFTSCKYSVDASMGIGTSSMHTFMFFESLPTEYVDVKSAEWRFDPSHPEIPVIVPKDYLSLYNFGFAAAKGLPQLSEGMIGMVPIAFTLTGNGLRETINGRIVGFSNRVNTVIVPSEFMEWSNARYGDGSVKECARLIVETNTPGDVKIEEYVKKHNYEIAGDKVDSGKANYFLTLVTGIVVAVGVLISLLSFFVLMLSIYLLLQKNTKKLQDLLLLGYSPSEVSKPYIRMVVTINGAVLVLALVAMIMARLYYMGMIKAMGLTGGSLVPAIAVGIVIMCGITIGNVAAIRSKIRGLWLQ